MDSYQGSNAMVNFCSRIFSNDLNPLAELLCMLLFYTLIVNLTNYLTKDQ